MTRKPIQICVTNNSEGDQIYALCDDGTIWERDYREHLFPSGWRLQRLIPQCPVEEADL